MKLKKFTELLNRREGHSTITFLVLLVVMLPMVWILLPTVNDWLTNGNDWVERPDTGFTNNDDADDGTDPTRDTIQATDKALLGGATLAKGQTKIKADFTSSLPLSDLKPGMHRESTIQGNGNSGYNIWMDCLDVNRNPTSIAFDGTFPNSTFPPTSGSRTYLVYLPPGDTVPFLNEEIFMIMATDQGHYYNGNIALENNYPNGSYYYSGSIPNVTYVDGNLSGNGNKIIYGIYYVKGDVSINDNVQLQGIVICEGNFTANSGGNKRPNIYGGVVQYGSLNILRGNGNPVEIQISDAYFSALRAMLPSKSVVSWQGAGPAN